MQSAYFIKYFMIFSMSSISYRLTDVSLLENFPKMSVFQIVALSVCRLEDLDVHNQTSVSSTVMMSFMNAHKKI